MTFRIAGINFDHMHMGDNLRAAFEHPGAEIVGICDEEPARMQNAVNAFDIPSDRLFTDYRRCLELTRPDLVILCPATGHHALWVERVAPYGVNVVVEKPFAASLAEADRMIAAMRGTAKLLAINWPLAWYPPYITTKRLIDQGAIGEVLEVHHYGGNRGPLWHTADKIEMVPTPERKAASWFYDPDRGGGSMLDYLGYGTTLGTWFQGGRKPLEVTAVVDRPEGLRVDEHSITVARYAHGLSKFETRWGTFTDPWVLQPQPKCGFVIVGTEGTISAYDYDSTIRLQTHAHPEGRDLPIDRVDPPNQNLVQYLRQHIETGKPIDGPLSIEISRVGQQIVDTAFRSAQEGRTLPLID